MPLAPIKPGDLCPTPFEPRGVVEVVEIEPGTYFGRTTALVRFVKDHAGYEAGSLGRYTLDELRRLED